LFSDYFSEAEIRCRCDLGSKCPAPLALEPTFRGKLLEVRLLFGLPMTVTSGIRCPYWNDKNSGAVDSWHLKAGAVDVRSKGAAYNGRLVKAALEAGIMGIGIRGGKAPIVHLDNRVSKVPEFFGY